MTTFAPPLPGLRASDPHPLPFAPDLHVRSFLLERDHGNVLVYGSETAPALAADASWQYLNHWHESMFGVVADLPVVVHEADAVRVAGRAGIVPVTFAVRHSLGEGFELVPTPGHTPGATAYLYERGGHRYLFTGDTIYLRDGAWVDAVLADSDPVAYRESLELIRSLDFDVLVPWAASAGEPFHAFTGPADTRRRIDALLRRL